MEENINGKKLIKIICDDEQVIGKKPIKMTDEKIEATKNHTKTKKYILLICIIAIIAVIFLLNLKVDIETVKNSVVMIKVYDQNDNLISTGSGFCAFKSNYVVTNFHVIEGAYKINIITDDDYSYKVNNILIFNANDDLAILSGNFELQPIRLTYDESLKAGENVTAIGSPKGQLNTVSTGIISNADDDFNIRITAPISPGSSGGVLLNSRNRVIGVTYATYDSIDAQNINYAISVKYLKELYNVLEKKTYTTITWSEYGDYIDKYNTDWCYKISSLELFYKMTSTRGKLEYFLTNENTKWKSIYDGFSEKRKQEVVSLIEIINSKEYEDDICSNIGNWNITEFFMNLEIVEPYEYAIISVDLENYTNKNKLFNRVNSYSLDVAEKTLILYLIGEYKWEDIHDDNKEDIFDYLDDRYNTKEMGAILEVLGYRVVYKDKSFTAYW